MPREAFDNEDVKTGMQLMMSPDGKAARFIVTHEGNAMGPEGVEHVEKFPEAIQIALKETSLAGAKIYIGGAGSNNKDIKTYAASDLLIVAIAAFILIFLIMLFITRSLMAALVIPGTVAFSFAGAFGLSVLVWQHLIGLHLHWLVLPITFIILVAVGSDYNLLLIARVKEEMGAGLHTGLIRALGSTGGVVTSAGLVFAFTMLAMLTSDLRTIGQVGTTVCIGLLLDTLIVRSFIVPCLLRLLGPWFWWPTLVRSRPLRQASDFRSEAMNSVPWALLATIAFVAVVVFAALAVGVRRTPGASTDAAVERAKSAASPSGSAQAAQARTDVGRGGGPGAGSRRPTAARSWRSASPRPSSASGASTSSAASSTCTVPPRRSGRSSG